MSDSFRKLTLEQLISELEAPLMRDFISDYQQLGMIAGAIIDTCGLPESEAEYTAERNAYLYKMTIGLAEHFLKNRGVKIFTWCDKGEGFEYVEWKGTKDEAIDHVKKKWIESNGTFPKVEDWIWFTADDVSAE